MWIKAPVVALISDGRGRFVIPSYSLPLSEAVVNLTPMSDQSEPIATRHPAWPWANVAIEQRHYPALILRWEKHWSNHGGYMWSARVTYLDGDEHKTTLIPAARVTRVG